MTSSNLTLPDLQAKMNQLKMEQSSLALPPLSKLEAEIQFHSARVHVGAPEVISHHKACLSSAIHAKQMAEESWQRNGKINSELQDLDREYTFVLAEDRKHNAVKASQDLQQAASDYEAAAKQVVRAFRRCMQVSSRNAGIPGAATSLPLGPHIPLRGFGFGGGFSTAEEMRMGLLPFEKEEQS